MWLLELAQHACLSPYFSNAGCMALRPTTLSNYYCIIWVKEHLYLTGRMHLRNILFMLHERFNGYLFLCFLCKPSELGIILCSSVIIWI